jgi:hypothetical protein
MEAMDGTRVELGPGDVSLGEDSEHQGRCAKTKGPPLGQYRRRDVTLMVIELD